MEIWKIFLTAEARRHGERQDQNIKELLCASVYGRAYASAGYVSAVDLDFLHYPQHPAEVLLQSQDGGPPVTMLLMMAAAQPTPAFTVMAPNSQFRAQAPHSMHRSLSVIAARLSRISKTRCGQTSTHLPQPVHLSRAYWSVVTFARYFIRSSIL
jgi:hypothetical protein